MEAEQIFLLQQRNRELEKQVKERTQKLQEQLERDRLLSGIALRIRESLCLDETLKTIVREVQQFLGCDRVLLYQLSPDGTGSVAQESVVAGRLSILGRSFPAEVFPQEYYQLYRQGRIRAIEDVEKDDVSPCLKEFLQQFDAKAKLVVPILQKKELWGLLVAHHCSETRQWQPLDINLLKQLATHIAIALQQAALYHQTQTELLERKKAQALLEESNSLLCATLDSTNDGIVIVDTKGKLVSFNHTFLEMWDIPESIVESRDEHQALVILLDQLKDPVSYLEKIRELYSQPKAESYDLIECKDGRYFERYSRPQFKAGQIIGRAFSFRDITERKLATDALQKAHDQLEIQVEARTSQLKDSLEKLRNINQQLHKEIIERQWVEKALWESKERFRNLVETSSDWTWEIDEFGIYTYVCPKVYDILGYEPEEIWGKTIFDLMPKEEAWRVASILGAIVAKQEPFICIENTFIHKNGHLAILECSGVPYFDPHGLFQGYRGVNRDITERKRAESVLRQQALVFENIEEGLIITDLQGRIIDWNRGAQRMFGYSKEEALGKTPAFLHTPEEGAVLTQQILLTVSQDDRWAGEIQFIRQDGTEGICETIVVPVENQSGERVAIISVNHDITQRKQAEIEIRKALEKEKELSELKTRFLSMASHDFRTPLATILSSSELLKYYSHRFNDDEKLKYLNKIQGQVANMTHLLDDVLFLGKAESGRINLKFISLNLPAFCRELIDEISTTKTQIHNIEFECNADSLFVEVEQTLIRKIIINLLSNAVKYSPQSSIVKLILTDEIQQIIIKIADQGIGIPLSEQPHLFEIFHRASNVGNVSGTGLGMAIVKEAVDLHGGTISFESKEGVGTMFTICIPKKQLKN